MIVNDFLMAIFFLLVGLEIKHELLYGHLSSIKKASFPIISAIGFLLFNHNNEFSIGVGIPISTDIAFAVGIFMILKNKLNPSLKIFLLSLAVVDDLISILAIGVLYSSNIQYNYILMAGACMIVLIALNKVFNINKSLPYLLVGLLLWVCIYSSGVHATISGIFIAMTIPSKKPNKKVKSMLENLEHKLSPMCNLMILPLFALVNTSISINNSISFASVDKLVCGIVIGLVVGMFPLTKAWPSPCTCHDCYISCSVCLRLLLFSEIVLGIDLPTSFAAVCFPDKNTHSLRSGCICLLLSRFPGARGAREELRE